MVTVCVSQNPAIKFHRINDEYIVEAKRNAKVIDDSIIFSVQVASNVPVAMIHRSEYALNKMSFRRPVTNLNDTSIWFLNEHLADISFKSGQSKNASLMKLPGHRMILGSTSEAIGKLLEESLARGVNEIDLSNFSFESVHTLIRFLYTGQLIIEYDHLSESLEILNMFASNKWPVLVEQLVKLITTQTVLPVYEFTLAHGSSNLCLLQLKEFCLNFIDVNADIILTDESFMKINSETLTTILQRDTLLTRENRLFASVNNWSKGKCAAASIAITPTNQLGFIGDALRYIRFTAMTAGEFAAGPAQSGLVSNEDTVKFLMHVANNYCSDDANRNLILYGKPRNQQVGWTNGHLDIRGLTPKDIEEPILIQSASAPKCNDLNDLACSCDEKIENKLSILYPNLKY